MSEYTCNWKTDLEEVEAWVQKAKRAQVIQFAESAGKRPIYLFAYGEQALQPAKTNYNSACGAHDPSAHVNRADKKPVIMLVGGIHGQETEAIAALFNLISLLETGVDLDGNRNDAMLEAAEHVRLLIIPVMNPDGRARVKPQAMVGLTYKELRYWGQGTWTDGSLCNWPDCKKIHPILGHTQFLGAYYNDNGINMMHDQFFAPMAEETAALMRLTEAEQVDCALLLHGGGNSLNSIIMNAFVPQWVNEQLRTLAQRCRAQGERFPIFDVPKSEADTPFSSFNLASALHHVNGSVSAVFESNECIVDMGGTKQTAEEIIRGHMVLFEQACRMFYEQQTPRIREALEKGE